VSLKCSFCVQHWIDIFVRLDLRGSVPPATHYHFNHWLWARVWCLVSLTHSVDAAIKQNCRKKHVFQWNIFYFNFLCAGGYSLRGDDSGFLMLKNTTKVKWSYRQRGLWMHLEWEIKSTFDKLFAISQKRYKIDTSDTFCERRIACTFYRIVTLPVTLTDSNNSELSRFSRFWSGMAK